MSPVQIDVWRHAFSRLVAVFAIPGSADSSAGVENSNADPGAADLVRYGGVGVVARYVTKFTRVRRQSLSASRHDVALQHGVRRWRCQVVRADGAGALAISSRSNRGVYCAAQDRVLLIRSTKLYCHRVKFI